MQRAPQATRKPAPKSKAPKARLLSLAGFVLALASLLFVGQRLHQHLEQFSSQVNLDNSLLFAAAVLVFTTSQLLLSQAWYLLLKRQGETQITARQSHLLCGRAQLSKYIPGNVFQYVARHFAFRQRGVSDGTLMLAAAYETLCFVVAAGALALVGLPFFARRTPLLSPQLAALISLGALLGLVLLVRHGHTLLALVGRAPPTGVRVRARELLSLVPLYAAFLTCSGILALVLFRSASGDAHWHVAVIPAYSLAWLCGYVVPGASGGLGIREATLIMLLGDNAPGLFVSVGMRLVTTFGDVLWFAASSALGEFGAESS